MRISDIELPRDCLVDICTCGDNSPACNQWLDMLKLRIPRTECINYLRQFGVWTFEELSATNHRELKLRVIWCIAWDQYESEVQS